MKLAAMVLMLPLMAGASMYEETRYCGPPVRDMNGQIVRNQSVLRIFQRIHPCPATGLQTGSCPGWAIDHVIPLACGGCDAVRNLQWLDTITKAQKDRYERRIYPSNPPTPYTPTCNFRVTP